MSIKIITNDEELRSLITRSCKDIMDDADICFWDCRVKNCNDELSPCVALVEDASCAPSECVYVAALPISAYTIRSIALRLTQTDEYDANRQRLKSLFEEMGLLNDRKGTLYLIDAVRMYPSGKVGTSMQSILRAVGNKYSVSTASVERAMRTAIEYLFRYGNRDKIYSLFGNTIDPDKGKPSNGEFIALMAQTVNDN